jgi:Zn-dependent membrane protease YugP
MMDRYKKSLLSAISIGSSAAGQWIFLVLLSKSGGPLWVGYYALSWAILFPVFRLTSLSLREIFS